MTAASAYPRSRSANWASNATALFNSAGELEATVCSPAASAAKNSRAVVGEDQFLLAGEVPVEGGKGHTCLFDDPVNADAMDALGVEDPRSGFQQAFTGR